MEGYLENEVQEMKGLRDRVGAARKDQVVSDEEFVKMMRGGLVAVKVKRGKSREQWFTKENGKLRCRRPSMGQSR